MVALKDIRSRRDEILQIIRSHGGIHVRVFGSVVREAKAEPGDVDFLVGFEQGRSLLDQVAMIQDLADFLGVRVDVVPEDALHYAIRDQVLREAVDL